MSTTTTYEGFKAAWLAEAMAGATSSVEKGGFFAHKLFRQWRGLDEDEVLEDLHHCDGAYDGGIDLAYLERGSETDPEAGNTWYLIQSKYGEAMSGPNTIAAEGNKILSSLDGLRHLNKATASVLTKISSFMKTGIEEDRLVVVFMTVDPLTAEETAALGRIRTLGRVDFGKRFDVEAVSIRTIFDLQDKVSGEPRVSVNISGNLSVSGPDLLLGSVSLLGLYQFLGEYKRKNANNLNRIFEKNIRQHLQTKATNKRMRQTIEQEPERFGMYNNGITIVADSYEILEPGKVRLTEPYIVNGCQTTNSIWQILDQKLDIGSSALDPETQAWKARAEEGVVVVKIVKTNGNQDGLMEDITRYTNAQTAVKGRDFIALSKDFQAWQKIFERRFGIYLEVQAGGADARRELQARSPHSSRKITEFVSAQNLLKFYAAAWMKDPGTAYKTAAQFSPGGKAYEDILAQPDFGVDDLYAAYLLFKNATGEDYAYGSKRKAEHRSYTKFLFCYVVMEVMERILLDIIPNMMNADRTRFISRVLSHKAARDALLDAADGVIKDYFTQGRGESYHDEPSFKTKYNGNINEFLKWKELPTESKILDDHIRSARKAIRKQDGLFLEAIKDHMSAA